jgi:hypothetical protein
MIKQDVTYSNRVSNQNSIPGRGQEMILFVTASSPTPGATGNRN